MSTLQRWSVMQEKQRIFSDFTSALLDDFFHISVCASSRMWGWDKKMPKIDTLDALEEHEEHEDDYQTNFFSQSFFRVSSEFPQSFLSFFNWFINWNWFDNHPHVLRVLLAHLVCQFLAFFVSVICNWCYFSFQFVCCMGGWKEIHGTELCSAPWLVDIQHIITNFPILPFSLISNSTLGWRKASSVCQ